MMAPDLDALAEELLAAYDAASLIDRPSARPAGLTLEQAFAVGDRLRRRRIDRGDRTLGY